MKSDLSRYTVSPEAFNVVKPSDTALYKRISRFNMRKDDDSKCHMVIPNDEMRANTVVLSNIYLFSKNNIYEL